MALLHIWLLLTLVCPCQIGLHLKRVFCGAMLMCWLDFCLFGAFFPSFVWLVPLPNMGNTMPMNMFSVDRVVLNIYFIPALTTRYSAWVHVPSIYVNSSHEKFGMIPSSHCMIRSSSYVPEFKGCEYPMILPYFVIYVLAWCKYENIMGTCWHL